MKKTYYCTREIPLRMQLDDEECMKISEINLKGIIDCYDLLLLSDMSMNGNLRIIGKGIEQISVSKKSVHF